MLIRKFTHACLHITDGDASVLIDPGSYSPEVEPITGLTAILFTHAHRDHLDPERLARIVQRNPHAAVYADADSAAAIAGDPLTESVRVTTVTPGDRWEAGTEMAAFGGEHAVIHADLPRIGNVGYLIGGRLYHPGDALVAPDAALWSGSVEILALPIAAPWMAFKEAVEFVRRVEPRLAIPIHEGVLASPAASYGRLEGLLPQRTELVVIDDGTPLEV